MTILYGPPGTGKTKTLMDILEEELRLTPPEKIAYVSFTKEGSEQGAARAMQRFGFKRSQLPYFRTLHSLAFKQMEYKRHQVMAWDDYRTFSKKIGMHFLGYYTEDLINNDDKYLFWIDLYRNNPKAANKLLADLDTEKLEYVRKTYRDYKNTFAKIDYTDMVGNYAANNISVPVDVAFIDEAQDLTSLQWKMVWVAFRRCQRIYIAGDDDQAIYQWSGADVDYFLGIQGEARVLGQSWRLPSSVLDFSKKISSRIGKRVPKDFKDRGTEGSVKIINSLDEVEIDPSKSYMFLSRNNTFLDDIDSMLMKRGLIFSHKGKPSISDGDMEIIRAYERVRTTRELRPDDKAVINANFKAGRVSDMWFDRIRWSQEKTDYVRYIIGNKIPIVKPNINVSTIHAVKGGEADVVVMLLDITRSVNQNLDNNPDSEHRVFYVGATRAKEKLYVVNSHSKFSYPIV